MIRSLTRRLGTPVWLWPALGAVSVAVLVAQLGGPHATAWHFFDDASHLLVGSGPDGEAGGLHLYRDHPEFQFGPLSIVAVVPFAFLGSDVGVWVAMATASLAGLIVFALVLATVDRVRPGLVDQTPPATLFVSGTVVVVTWGDVAVRTAHIDDAIALVAITASLWCCAAGRGRAATIAIAIATAAKPWAVIAAPLVLVPPGRHRGVRLVTVAAIVALTWAPFALAEPATLETTRFGIENDATSVLRAFGFDDGSTPGWVRPAQLGGGVLVVGILVARRRWPAALLAGIAWRLLLEPGAHRYYTVGLVLGALLVELLARPGRIPWATVVAAVVLEVTALPDVAEVPGRTLRLACVVAALAAAFLAPLTGRWFSGGRLQLRSRWRAHCGV